MEYLFYCTVAIYLVMGGFVFKKWHQFLDRDPSMSSQRKSLFRAVLAFMTILWPIIVPISYMELLNSQLLVDNF